MASSDHIIFSLIRKSELFSVCYCPTCSSYVSDLYRSDLIEGHKAAKIYTSLVSTQLPLVPVDFKHFKVHANLFVRRRLIRILK